MSPGTEPFRSVRTPQPVRAPHPVRIAPLPARIGLLLAGLGSLLAAVLGGWWLVQPQRNAFVGGFDPLSLPAALPGAVSATLLLVLGTIGVFTVIAAWATGAVPVTGQPVSAQPVSAQAVGAPAISARATGVRRFLTGIVLLEGLGFMVLCADATLLMEMGYLMAGLLPIGFVIVAVLLCRRSVTIRWIIAAGVAAAAVWAVLTPTITLQTVPDLVTGLVSMLARVPLSEHLLPGFALTTVGWGLLARTLLVGAPVLSRANTIVSRIGVTATWLAVAGPIPYVLTRITWLTPWPQFGSASMPGDIQLWGMLLGGGGLVGSILTVGLLCRWGRTFPSWMPVIGGRRVPVRVAVIPATGVGLAVTLAAGPMVANAVTSGSVRSTVEGLVVLPLWLWGPALLIATWAYALRRRHDQPGQGQPGQGQHSWTGVGPTTDGHPADGR